MGAESGGEHSGLLGKKLMFDPARSSGRGRLMNRRGAHLCPANIT
jgi:hypothetical protein